MEWKEWEKINLVINHTMAEGYQGFYLCSNKVTLAHILTSIHLLEENNGMQRRKETILGKMEGEGACITE